jgi:hypothetical protein
MPKNVDIYEQAMRENIKCVKKGKKNNQKGEAHQTVRCASPMDTEIAYIHWAFLCGNGNNWNKRRRQN